VICNVVIRYVTVGYAITNKFFSQYNQYAATNTDATTNAKENYRPTSHAPS